MPSLNGPMSLATTSICTNRPFALFKKTLVEARDGVMARMARPPDETECHRTVGRLLQLAAGEHTRGIAVEQKGQQ